MVDTELFTAWREGRLIFKSTRLEIVLKQLSRWYDVKFEYEEEGLKDLIFSGKMKKYDNGNVILGILKATRLCYTCKETIKTKTLVRLKTNNHEKKFINPQSGIQTFSA